MNDSRKQLMSDALHAARIRGEQYILSELSKSENLNLGDAARYSGRSQSAIKVARESGQIYALAAPHRPHEFRYPRWQFDVEPGRLRAALAPFVQANASCWAVHNFMQRPMEALGGLRPMDWLSNPERPISDLVELAAQRYNSDQGAG